MFEAAQDVICFVKVINNLPYRSAWVRAYQDLPQKFLVGYDPQVVVSPYLLLRVGTSPVRLPLCDPSLPAWISRRIFIRRFSRCKRAISLSRMFAPPSGVEWSRTLALPASLVASAPGMLAIDPAVISVSSVRAALSSGSVGPSRLCIMPKPQKKSATNCSPVNQLSSRGLSQQVLLRT